jgi:23S rRNA-/tRNA-specific pseudouridylate synthase
MGHGVVGDRVYGGTREKKFRVRAELHNERPALSDKELKNLEGECKKHGSK